jgi:diadenylate cyclase
MFNALKDIIAHIGLQDLLDIAAVSIVLYWILLLIRGTRAIQMVFGLVVLGGGYFLAQAAELNTFEWILENFLGSIVIVIVIIFQDEIRRALALVGSNPLTGSNPGEQRHLIDELVKTAVALSSKRIGALIVIERNIGLKNYIEKGTPIEGTVSKDLFLSIFMPFSPIHDGAVIISGGRIAAAQCFLPLTVNPRLGKVLGTRHRAALGLTEETDAVVIVLSEETGKISTACEGKLYSRLEAEELRRMLERMLASDEDPQSSHLWERIKIAVRSWKKSTA